MKKLMLYLSRILKRIFKDDDEDPFAVLDAPHHFKGKTVNE